MAGSSAWAGGANSGVTEASASGRNFLFMNEAFGTAGTNTARIVDEPAWPIAVLHRST